METAFTARLRRVHPFQCLPAHISVLFRCGILACMCTENDKTRTQMATSARVFRFTAFAGDALCSMDGEAILTPYPSP